MVAVRWFVVLLAGCSFKASSAVSGDARGDGIGLDAVSDAPGDGSSSATPDAKPDAFVQAQISYVQGDNSAGMASQATLTFLQAIAAGDVGVVGVGINGNAITSVTDTGNNTYTSVGTVGSETVYVAPNMHASANDKITIQFSGTTGFTAAAAQYRGIATASPVDGSSAASGTGNALDSGPVSTTHPHDLLVGVAVSSGTMAAGSSYTLRTGGMYSMIEDEEVTSGGSRHATATAAANLTWSLRVVALKAAD
jgi:hypothetical protein